MDIKLISKELKQNLYDVDFTEEEIDAISSYVNLNDCGIELVEGRNLLEKDILWFILAELNNRRNFPNRINLDVIERLKSTLYPSEE